MRSTLQELSNQSRRDRQLPEQPQRRNSQPSNAGGSTDYMPRRSLRFLFKVQPSVNQEVGPLVTKIFAQAFGGDSTSSSSSSSSSGSSDAFTSMLLQVRGDTLQSISEKSLYGGNQL